MPHMGSCLTPPVTLHPGIAYLGESMAHVTAAALRTRVQASVTFYYSASMLALIAMLSVVLLYYVYKAFRKNNDRRATGVALGLASYIMSLGWDYVTAWYTRTLLWCGSGDGASAAAATAEARRAPTAQKSSCTRASAHSAHRVPQFDGIPSDAFPIRRLSIRIRRPLQQIQRYLFTNQPGSGYIFGFAIFALIVSAAAGAAFTRRQAVSVLCPFVPKHFRTRPQRVVTAAGRCTGMERFALSISVIVLDHFAAKRHR